MTPSAYLEQVAQLDPADVSEFDGHLLGYLIRATSPGVLEAALSVAASDVRDRWLPIPGYAEGYEVSDGGSVRSHRFGGPRTRVPRLMKPYVDSTGYPGLRLDRLDGSRPHVRVHTLVLAAFVGPRPEGMCIRHLNGDSTDNSLANLAYGTYMENSQDTADHGRNHWSNVTHCPSGHEYTPDNTKVGKRGNGRTFRICRTCAAERWARA